MKLTDTCQQLYERHVVQGNHAASDYFGLVKHLLQLEEPGNPVIDDFIGKVYDHIRDELIHNSGKPLSEITFGTSGWRGILGKDIFVMSVTSVTRAIIKLYHSIDSNLELAPYLGVSSLQEARRLGCLVGFDNRFGGEILGRAVTDVLVQNGFKVYYCGETTTGVLSAALIKLQGAFSVNLTPSHNPLEYGGYKYNAADAGPAASELTSLITTYAREIVASGEGAVLPPAVPQGEVIEVDSFALWQKHVTEHENIHGIDYQNLMERAADNQDLSIVIDSMHGASRLHLERLLGRASKQMELLRGGPDVTFGGIAPEPSSVNIQGVTEKLNTMNKKLKIGAIIDPDGDRIRFSDGTTEISMNQFGAMAYHFIHEHKNKTGMVAKTVATSNMANAVAIKLGEDVFEPRVGFKEFKPVIGKALVYFEESDGISIIGHTPEKDAYIGLLLALDMVLSTGKNLGDFKRELEEMYGLFCPDRDGVVVSLKGEQLIDTLALLEKYHIGSTVQIGSEEKSIKEIISIDGRKMIFEDDSWLMIRPSGTEPKVRFYVESRDPDGTVDLLRAARKMLQEVGLIAQ